MTYHNKVMRFYVKGLVLYPFLVFYFSSWTPVDQPHTPNYPKKKQTKPNKLSGKQHI